MGHQNTEMDVESLQKSDRRRGSCLDVFFIVSIIFLFAAVTAMAVVGMMVVMNLQSKLETPIFASQTSKLTGDVQNTAYKMQNFAYLRAKSSELKNATMNWTKVPYGEKDSVGSNFEFDSEQHSLQPKRAGTYFMYIDLNLTCTFQCNAGFLTVDVGDKLTCKVEIPKDSTSVSRKCWTVSRINEQKLITQMTVPKEGLQYWILQVESSGFGMFLVD